MKAKKFSFHAVLLCIAALFVTLLLLLSSCGEKTADEKDFTYTVENGQATVASYTPSGEISPKLIIPSTLGGYPVVRIGEGAFSGLKNIKEIVLPDSVTDIGKEAFKDCSDLTNITIPDSVSNIGQVAFSGCTNLKNIYITDISAWCKISGLDSLMNSAAGLYLNNEPITNLVIPDGVTSIGSYAFKGCTGLTSITIPDSVTSIGRGAFEGCTGLTSITIGNGVTDVDFVWAFSYIERLYYTGTREQWEQITNGDWPSNVWLYSFNYRPTA